MNTIDNHAAFLAARKAAGAAFEKKEEPTLEDLHDMLGDLRGIAQELGDVRALKSQLGELEEIKSQSSKVSKDLDLLSAEVMRRRSQVTDGGRPVAPELIEHKAAFETFLRQPGSDQAIANLKAAEHKTASGATGAAGGFGIPELLLPTFMSRAKDTSVMRSLAMVVPVGSSNVRIASSNNDANSGWVGENDNRAGTTEPTLREAVPTFGMVYTLLEASEELVMDSQFPVGQWFAQSAGDEIAKAEGVSFIGGDGTNKPTGFLNLAPEAASDAVGRTEGALQYIPGGSAAALTDPDVLITLVYTVRAEYRANATWLMNSATAGVVRKMKDTDGRYLWQDGLSAGQPALLVGYPVAIDENMPDIAADALPIAFGDFRKGYVIADHGSIRITLDDNISTPGKVKWYIRRRVGGAVLDDHAVKLIKIATT